MKLKSIFIAIISACLAIILYKNNQEASFWLFKEYQAPKLYIIGVVFLLGVIFGALVFRRKRKHPKAYSLSGEDYSAEKTTTTNINPDTDGLSDADKEYLSRD